MRLISIVVPTHNEAPNVSILYEKIREVFKPLAYEFELIFADDSTDDTPDIIAELNTKDERVKLIRLTRSFGQTVAIAAGLAYCKGDAAVIMDADLQDPPEAIPQLIEKWERGAKVVYVKRPSDSKTLVYKLCAKFFYKFLGKLSTVSIPMNAGEFRLLDRTAIDFMNNLKERSRFIRGLTVWPGFKMDKVTITRTERSGGTTKYNFFRSLSVAVDGFVSFSIIPLRIAVVLGFFFASLSFILGSAYFIVWLFNLAVFGKGWTSLILCILFMGGLNLMCLGIAGEYIGRCFIELQGRPVYMIDYTIGFEEI